MDITLTAEIQADTSRTDIYPVTETKDGYTLESVTVSPFSTEIRFSEDTVFDDYDVMYVTDQNGNSYDMIDANIDTDISFQNSVWEAALTDATELTIRIVPDGKTTWTQQVQFLLFPLTKVIGHKRSMTLIWQRTIRSISRQCLMKNLLPSDFYRTEFTFIS